jgi:hypothetical protein
VRATDGLTDFGYEAALEVKAPYYEVKVAVEAGKLKSTLLLLDPQT